jgi:COP9 signalosome complex subunit 6
MTDKQVFPRLDLVGWYATGDSMDAQDLSINQEIMAMNESPCILLLDTTIDPLRKNLPVTLYETEVHILDGAPTSTLVTADYSIETSDAERIGVDQVAKISVHGDSGTDQLTAHLSGVHSAIKMLHERVAAIQMVVQEMDQGKQPFDHALVRKISCLVHSLPAMDRPEFKEEYAREVNDALMNIQLALVTKGEISLLNMQLEGQAELGNESCSHDC